MDGDGLAGRRVIAGHDLLARADPESRAVAGEEFPGRGLGRVGTTFRLEAGGVREPGPVR